MQKDINTQKQLLVEQTKEIAKEITHINSFSGLISLESRLQQLLKNISILSYLDHIDWHSENENTIHTPIQQVEENISQSQPNKEAEGIIRKKLALDLNDKIAFINQLFNKDNQLFQEALDALNNTNNLHESQQLINKWIATYNWTDKESFIERLREMVKNRFE